MARINKKAIGDGGRRVDTTVQLAGGYGAFPAKQGPEALLRRAVLANLLWEKLFYEKGESVASNIRTLIPQVDPARVAAIAVEARNLQKLRHVPLFIAREMARLNTHKGYVGELLPQIIKRADELSEFISIYWKDGKQPLSKQVQKGLAQAFHNFDTYQLAKYNRDSEVKLRDVAMLCKVKAGGNSRLGVDLAKLINKTFYPDRTKSGFDVKTAYGLREYEKLPSPDTWEVAHSAGKGKCETWVRLITERKIGALAFVRNLRAMDELGVPREVILQGFQTINPRWLLPLNYLAAAKYASRYEREIEELMYRGLATAPKLPGYSILIVDVSGSMGGALSAKSEFNRMQAASAMAVLAAEMCEHISVYATAGNDHSRIHQTEVVPPRRGFGLSDAILSKAARLGGGGIFTRQCLEYVKTKETAQPDRIIVFSDSQDCDYPNKRIPHPFGVRNYIIDVSSESYGVNYDGVWTSEISGWSEHFLAYIAALEGIEMTTREEESDSLQEMA
jgi:60 kDa SS-A/Ro ribonucleoprotein